MARERIGGAARPGAVMCTAFALVAALAGCGGEADDPGRPASGSSPTEAAATDPSGTQATEKRLPDEILAAVNAARTTPRRCGTVSQPAVGTLAWNPLAEEAALAHARYLQRNDLFSHTGENGSGVGDRLGATGYAWSHAGENLAAGFDGVAAVMQAWIDSPGHCSNLMNPAFTEVAVTVVEGTSANTYRNYWVMVLARPRR